MIKIESHLIGESISTNSAEAFSLNKKSGFGELVGGKIKYSFAEALYLLEKGKISVLKNKKNLSFDELMGKLKRIDSRIQIKYPVFRDLREKGYILKTALKFGADFRVYSNKEKHSKWIVFCEHESKKFSWHEFSAKNRVAHSTRKKLLLAILDEESDVTYYEVGWIKT